MFAMSRHSSHRCASTAAALVILAISALAVAKPPPVQPSEAEKPTPTAPANTEPIDTTFPAVTVRLFPIKDDEGAKKYAEETGAKIDELSARFDAMKEPAARLKLALATANLILSEGVEVACSRSLNGLRLGDGARKEVSKSLDRADSLLSIATKIESERKRSDDGAPTKDAISLSHNLETISAFSTALRAYLVPLAGGDSAKTIRRATSALSPLLEDDNAAVAAAATLWQARLRSRSANPARAMSTLPLALTRPLQDGMPYAFFTRLLRCRLVAERGGTTAALSLLMQMEDRCDEWFVATADRQAALRTVMLAEVQMLQQWHKRLADSGDTEMRDWCAIRARRITEDHFDGTGGVLLRCSPAIPILVPIPERRTPDGTLDPAVPSG